MNSSQAIYLESYLLPANTLSLDLAPEGRPHQGKDNRLTRRNFWSRLLLLTEFLNITLIKSLKILSLGII